jgi:hypothetical protein
MFTCKQITELASKAQEEPLPFKQRFQFRLHLLMCKLCARYVKQLAFLRTSIKDLDHHASCAHLCSESKHRIKETLEKQSKI